MEKTSAFNWLSALTNPVTKIASLIAERSQFRFNRFFLMMLVGLTLSSCLPGSRLARKYLHQKEKEAIFLLVPDYLFKENLNTTAIPAYRRMDSLKQDSARYFSSCFIQYIDDSLFLKTFYEAMSDQLKKAGYEVFGGAGMPDFFTRNNAWMISIAQQGVEEYAYPFSQRGIFEDTIVYSEEINVNGIALNSWFELSQLNDTSPMKVFFNSSFLEDRVVGDFIWNPFKEEYPYFYSRSDITLDDVCVFAADAGRKNAGLLLDYFMNKYIAVHTKARLREEYYLHYDPQKKKLCFAKQEKLIPLSSE